MLDAAGRAFRQHGFGGVGIDGLAQAAGVTSGALYGHFKSKAGAFRAAVAAGLERLHAGVSHFQTQGGDAWLGPFVQFYLGRTHREDIAGGCALPSLSPEVVRAGADVQSDYRERLLAIADAIAAELPGEAGRRAAWPILAQLAGGVMLSRAVGDEVIAEEIAKAVADDLLGARG